MHKLVKIGLFAALAASFFSCAIDLRIDISEGEEKCVVSTSTECFAAFEKIAKSAAGTSDDQALFDKASVEKALQDANKTDISVETKKAPSSLATQFSSKSVKDILPIQKPFVSLDDSQKMISVNFNSEIAAQCLALLPDNLRDLSELLMAPIFTGEKSDEAEYRETIALVYGDSLAADLDLSHISLQVQTAGKVKNAYCSKKDFAKVEKKGRVIIFEVPLIKILCVQDNIQFILETE